MPLFQNEIKVPVVNINGDKKEELVKQALSIKSAIEGVEVMLANAMPHGRNFKDANDLHAARNAFGERRAVLKIIANEFYRLAEEIADQG